MKNKRLKTKRPKGKLRLLDVEFDFYSLWLAVDIDTAELLEMIADSIEFENLSEHKDLKVKTLRDAAVTIKKIESSEYE